MQWRGSCAVYCSSGAINYADEVSQGEDGDFSSDWEDDWALGLTIDVQPVYPLRTSGRVVLLCRSQTSESLATAVSPDLLEMVDLFSDARCVCLFEVFFSSSPHPWINSFRHPCPLSIFMWPGKVYGFSSLDSPLPCLLGILHHLQRLWMRPPGTPVNGFVTLVGIFVCLYYNSKGCRSNIRLPCLSFEKLSGSWCMDVLLFD